MRIAPDRMMDESSRAVSIRYFNFYRIVLASAFAIFGSVFNFGGDAHDAYQVLVAVYWLLAVVFAILPNRRGASNVLLAMQVSIDIWVLTAFMHFSGGLQSGIPYLLMTTIAGAGLVSQGRMVLAVAAMATIAVLFEQYLRVVSNQAEVGDFTRTGITCAGYFAIALIARLLARRALANEELARMRGADLDRQRRVNDLIIEDMLDGVVVVNDVGIVRQCNPSAVELLGIVMQPGEFLGSYSHELVRLAMLPQSDVAELTEADSRDALAFRAEVSGRSLRLRRVRAGDGGDLVLYLEDLDRLQAQAQQIKLAALGRLTANIAHEIRNPLSAITHASDLLAEEKRAEMQLRLLRIVRDNAARIERIVKDVLELGRRDRATVEMLDLLTFLRGFMEEFAVHTPAALSVLRMEVDGQPRIQFDRMHLHQVLNNLVGNAMRYCRGEAGSVLLTADEQEDGRVLIVVRDDGPGVAEADRAKIFEPFFTSDPKGTGLGLYIARELAEANGARLVLAECQDGAQSGLPDNAHSGACFELVTRGVT